MEAMGNRWDEAMKWRYATKSFDPEKKINIEVLDRLLEGLRLSPSSFGLQLWKFLVIEDPKLKTKLRPATWNQPQVESCSHLIVMCRRSEFSYLNIDRWIDTLSQSRGVSRETMTAYAKVMRDFVDKKSSEEIAQWMVHQVYIALGILMLGAALEGVDSCPIEGFDSARYDSILGLPDKGLKSVVLCALGFRSGQDRFTGAHKVRYPREDVVEFISSGNEV